MSFHRARRPEQKLERCQQILAAAAVLFSEKGFEGTSLNAIARQAGLAKSNLYRYFDSREEIFLALMVEDYQEYVAAVEEAIDCLAHTDDVEAVGKALTTAALERPRLCALTAVLSGVIEQNISEATYLRFKELVLMVSERIADALQVALPSLPEKKAYDFQRYLQALVSGLWPMSLTSIKFKEAMEHSRYEHFRVDFARDLEASVVATLRGLCAR